MKTSKALPAVSPVWLEHVDVTVATQSSMLDR